MYQLHTITPEQRARAAAAVRTIETRWLHPTAPITEAAFTARLQALHREVGVPAPAEVQLCESPQAVMHKLRSAPGNLRFPFFVQSPTGVSDAVSYSNGMGSLLMIGKIAPEVFDDEWFAEQTPCYLKRQRGVLRPYLQGMMRDLFPLPRRPRRRRNAPGKPKIQSLPPPAWSRTATYIHAISLEPRNIHISPARALAMLSLGDDLAWGGYDTRSVLREWCELCMATWWWTCTERVALGCLPPMEVHVNAAHEYHREGGPAITFVDGTTMWLWHDIIVPEEIGVHLAANTVTAAHIQKQTNAEVVRVLLERYGVERFFHDANAKRVDTWVNPTTGDPVVLWRVVMKMSDAVQYVELLNSTPEPDGTKKTYIVRVPPHTRRARTALAWTYDIPSAAFATTQET